MVAAPCAHVWSRGPARSGNCGLPSNGIVSCHGMDASLKESAESVSGEWEVAERVPPVLCRAKLPRERWKGIARPIK